MVEAVSVCAFDYDYYVEFDYDDYVEFDYDDYDYFDFHSVAYRTGGSPTETSVDALTVSPQYLTTSHQSFRVGAVALRTHDTYLLRSLASLGSVLPFERDTGEMVSPLVFESANPQCQP